MAKKQKSDGVASVTELRGELLNVFNGLVDGDENPIQAKAKVQAAGKILQSAALEIKYSQARGEMPQIEFMDR